MDAYSCSGDRYGIKTIFLKKNDFCSILFLVQRASGLLTKGKHSKNDCFVTIALGKIKYQTSIKEKADPDVEWHEECEL